MEQQSLWATTTEPALYSLGSATTEAHVSRACALQREATATVRESALGSLQLEKKAQQ